MVRLPETTVPLPCQIPVIVAKLMTAIQGLWYQLPVPDKGIFRGVSTRMNARVQHRNSLQKVISCLLVFCLLYTPCLATVMTIRKETESTRWTLGLVAFQMVFAWAVAVIIFQTGSLLLG